MRIANHLFFSLACCILLSGSAYATPASVPNAWFMGIGGGASWIGLPSSTSVLNGSDATPPMNQDHYSINTSTTGVFDFQVGYRWHLQKPYLPFINLYFQYMHFFKSDIKGTVEQYSLPAFENYRYKLHYEAELLTVAGKVDLIEYKNFLPFISGGLGINMNHVSGYSETALSNVTPRTSPHFNGNQYARGAATLGLGLDYIITKNIWATLGYEHVFQGQLRTTNGDSTWSGTKLNLGTAKLNTVFFNVSINSLPISGR